MRLIEVAGEPSANWVEVISTIDKDCHQYITELGGWKKVLRNNDHHALFRGMQSDEPVIKKDVRQARRPTDTPDEVHGYVDTWFNINKGHRFRSNAMFATGSDPVAGEYGRPYMVFPAGEYSTCYSPTIIDLWMFLEDVIDKHDEDDWHPAVDKVLESGKYVVDGKIDDAIETEHEVMITCEEYYGIRHDLYGEFFAAVKSLIKEGKLK